jgi:hypothetical protein
MNVYECIDCDYKTVRKNNYEKHLLTVLHNKKIQSEYGDNYKCVLCNYTTTYKFNYKRHVLKCDINNTNTHDKMLTATNDEHSDKKLSNKNVYKCNICNFESKHVAIDKDRVKMSGYLS